MVESLRTWYQGGDRAVPVPKVVVAIFGGVAGFCSVVGNNPIDVVKTRMQGLNAARYRNSLDCFAQVWRHEGPFSFYRGVTPRLTRVTVEVALTFLIYDFIQDAFQIFDE